MKKIMSKVSRKGRLKKQEEVPLRITNDTIIAHRQKVISTGKKFKYPLQYAKHKLVINTIILSFVALVLVGFIGWWQLYRSQNTSGFIYRVTAIVPVPVASIDDEPVRYSEYLMKYRSAEHYLQQKERVSLKTDDGQQQVLFMKQQSLRDAVADAYAQKIGRQKGVTVSDDELNVFLKQQRQSPDGEVSQQTYDAVIADYYGWGPSEYRHAMKAKLLRQKVSYLLDDKAKAASDAIGKQLVGTEVDFHAIADAYNKQSKLGVEYGASGWVPKTNQDGGLSTEAQRLERGGISKAIRSTTGDGYYYVRLLDTSDTQVSYEYIKVPLTVFDATIEKLYKENKVHKYISLPDEEEKK